MTGLMSSLYTKKTEDQFRSLDCAAGTDGVPKFGPATRNLCGHLGAWYRHLEEEGPDARELADRLESRQTRQGVEAGSVGAYPQLVMSHFLSHSACLTSPVSWAGETVCV
jgi:hypothetical protein